MANKKTQKVEEVKEEIEAVVLENVVTDSPEQELSVAEKFLAKEVKIANKVGLNPKRKLHLAMVRTEVQKSLKEDK